MKLASIIIKFLIGLGIMLGLSYLGCEAIEYLHLNFKKPNTSMWKDYFAILAAYLIFIKPMVAYWTDVVEKLLGIDQSIKNYKESKKS